MKTEFGNLEKAHKVFSIVISTDVGTVVFPIPENVSISLEHTIESISPYTNIPVKNNFKIEGEYKNMILN